MFTVNCKTDKRFLHFPEIKIINLQNGKTKIIILSFTHHNTQHKLAFLKAPIISQTRLSNLVTREFGYDGLN